MDAKPNCEVTIRSDAGEWVLCGKPAQIVVKVETGPINCCRNHATGVIDRVKGIGYKYKVEPIPPEP